MIRFLLMLEVEYHALVKGLKELVYKFTWGAWISSIETHDYQ
jgi:hypothetical protein